MLFLDIISYYIKLPMYRYLLCKYREPEAVILHVDSKSANLGPRLIFVSKF